MLSLLRKSLNKLTRGILDIDQSGNLIVNLKDIKAVKIITSEPIKISISETVFFSSEKHIFLSSGHKESNGYYKIFNNTVIPEGMTLNQFADMIYEKYNKRLVIDLRSEEVKCLQEQD